MFLYHFLYHFKASLYLYNYSTKAAEHMQKLFSNIISWHNGKSRLLREIGLHKMGITHLPATISPSSNALVWLNAPLLYKYDFPEMGTAEFDQQLVFHHVFVTTLSLFYHFYFLDALLFVLRRKIKNEFIELRCFVV